MKKGDTFRMNVADTKPYNADKIFRPSMSATGSVKSVLLPSFREPRSPGRPLIFLDAFAMINVFREGASGGTAWFPGSETPCCGKPLRAFTTTHFWKRLRGTRLIAEPNGKNVKDWAIRSVTSCVRCIAKYRVGYGGHSETERVLVGNDELTTLNWLKIQSGPLGNLGESPFDGDKHLVPNREREKRATP
jgi:hypothetical protein